MGGQCLLNNTIYQATVTQDDSGQIQYYIGLASTDWKYKPKAGAKSSNPTELSNHVWKLNKKVINHKIDWKILDKAQTFNPTTNKCRQAL